MNSVVQAPGGGTPPWKVMSGRLDAAAFDSPLALALEAKYPQIKVAPEAHECIEHPDIPFRLVGLLKVIRSGQNS